MVKVKHLEFDTEYPKIYFFNITQDMKDFIAESGIQNGTITVQSEHTTCAVFFEEWVHDEDRKGHDYLQIDLNNGLRRIFPDEVEFDGYYKYPGPKHLDRPGRPYLPFDGVCLNGPAHLKSTLVGASQTFVIENGTLQTGTWGSVWFADFDYLRPRKRRVVMCVMGE